MKKLILPLCLLTVVGCKNPFDRTHDASSGGPTGTFGNGSTFVIFNDELATGGGAFEYPGPEGQSLAFNDTSNSISRRSIRYSWTGEAAGGQTVFAGFDLIHVVDQSLDLHVYKATIGRNLTQAGYTQVSFFARGTLSSHTVMKIEVADDGDSNTAAPCITLSTSGSDEACLLFGQFPNPLAMAPKALTSSWQQFVITVPNSSLANIKDFFKATYVFTPAFGAPQGQGGTVYFDQIIYQQ